MDFILERKFTKDDSAEEIIDAIIKIAIDKKKRVLWEDYCEWLETKLKEIAKLGRILKRKEK